MKSQLVSSSLILLFGGTVVVPTFVTKFNCNAFQLMPNVGQQPAKGTTQLFSSSRRHLPSYDLSFERDADFGEILAGGQRYEMVELPDSMLDTTIFVGNLCEFVTDDILSALFSQVSSLNFVPACVARKPNMSSLKYGFVTFPSVSEKEAAILKFTGFELNNKKIKVEEIVDYKYRVRVPEKLVVYAVGELKRTREGQRNTMRKVSNSREGGGSVTTKRSSSPSHSSLSSSSKISMSSSKSDKTKDKSRDRRSKKRKIQTASSFMFGSDVGKRGSGGVYKNMKRKEARKNRRMNNYDLKDFGLI